MSQLELLQKIMARHAEIAQLMVEQGHAINALSTLVDDAAEPPAQAPTEPPSAPNPKERAKNMLTAAEWAKSDNARRYLTKPEFSALNEETAAKLLADFVAAQPPDERMNRWGGQLLLFYKRQSGNG